MARSNDGEREGPWPQVKWLKVEVLTATVKSSAPREVEHSYNEWLKWIDFIQEVRIPKFQIQLSNSIYFQRAAAWMRPNGPCIIITCNTQA